MKADELFNKYATIEVRILKENGFSVGNLERVVDRALTEYRNEIIKMIDDYLLQDGWCPYRKDYYDTTLLEDIKSKIEEMK